MSYESMALRLYEIKREMKKLEEEAAAISSELKESLEVGEMIDCGNGVYYEYTLQDKLKYGPAAIEKIANYGLLSNFKPQVSTTTLDALIKKRIITEEIAADIKSAAVNEPIQVLREKVLEGVV